MTGFIGHGIVTRYVHFAVIFGRLTESPLLLFPRMRVYFSPTMTLPS